MGPDFNQIPALQPPNGVVPNFVDPSNNNSGARAVIALCVILSTVAILSRLYSRVFVVRRVFFADFFVFTSYIIYLATIAIASKLAETPGYFVHQWDVNLTQLVPYLHTTFIGVDLNSVFMGLVKTSILVEWLRIFTPLGKASNKTLYYVLHAVLWANVLFYLSTFIVQNIACSPEEFTLNRITQGGSCNHANINIDTNLTDLSAGVINLVVDTWILVIPQHVIWRLNMSQRKKAGVAVLFLIGLLGVITAVFRVLITVRALANRDFVYNYGPVILCCLSEGACAILVVCGPTIPKTLQQLQLQLPLLCRSIFTKPPVAHSAGRNSQNQLLGKQNGGTASRTSRHTAFIGKSIWPPRGADRGFRSANDNVDTTTGSGWESLKLESFEAKNQTGIVCGEIQALPATAHFNDAGDMERGGILHIREFRVTREVNYSSSDDVGSFHFGN